MLEKQKRMKQAMPQDIKKANLNNPAGKKGKTDYILKNANLVNEKPKYAKGPITHKAKNNI